LQPAAVFFLYFVFIGTAIILSQRLIFYYAVVFLKSQVSVSDKNNRA